MDTATQKAHFFRRASFGATQQELGSSAKPKELLEHWLEDTQPLATLLGEQPEEPKPFEMDKKLKRMQLRTQGMALSQNLLEQMVTASNPLHERVVNFWQISTKAKIEISKL
jgi:hypothetical protein